MDTFPITMIGKIRSEEASITSFPVVYPQLNRTLLPNIIRIFVDTSAVKKLY